MLGATTANSMSREASQCTHRVSISLAASLHERIQKHQMCLAYHTLAYACNSHARLLLKASFTLDPLVIRTTSKLGGSTSSHVRIRDNIHA